MGICRRLWGLMRKAIKIGMVVAGFFALAVTIAFSFFAPGLAIMSGVLTVALAVVWADYQRRSVWEGKASKDIDILKMAMRRVSAEVGDVRGEVDGLKRVVRSKGSRVERTAEAVRTEKVAAAVLRQDQPVVKKDKVEKSDFAKVLKAAEGKPVVAQSRPKSKPHRSKVRRPMVKRRKRVKPSDIGVVVSESLKAKRVEMFVQPVVSLPAQKTRFYELYARLKGAGDVAVPANDYMGYARKNNVMAQIDGLLLMRSLKVIQASAHVKKATPFFVNVSSATLSDAAFMGRLLAFLKDKKNKALRERLIFEMSQKNYQDLPPVMIELMRGLGQLGCAFSLDQVVDFDLDVALLVRHKVRSVKIAAPLLIKEVGTYHGLTAMQKFVRRVEGNGISVIVDKVETKGQMRALKELGLSYGQGHLFGRPAPQASYARKSKVKKVAA